MTLEASDVSSQIIQEETAAAAHGMAKTSNAELSGPAQQNAVPLRSVSKVSSVSMHKPPGLTAKSRGINAKFRAPIDLNRSHENEIHAVNKCMRITDVNPSSSSSSPSAQFYCVMYRSRKKNSKNRGPWLDGVLIVRRRKSSLLDTEGKTVCKGDISGGMTLAVDAIIEVNPLTVKHLSSMIFIISKPGIENYRFVYLRYTVDYC
mgnify:CR=1 FL=1